MSTTQPSPSEKEIEEGNRIIADFMGPGSGIWKGFDRESYHSSWDWLMAVISKVGDIISDRDMYNRQDALARWTPIKNELANANLNNTWFCVVQFINWYNNQPKK